MEGIKIEKGAGLVSVQVWTDELPGRPFQAYAVLCDIKEDGTILRWKGDKQHREQVLKHMLTAER